MALARGLQQDAPGLQLQPPPPAPRAGWRRCTRGLVLILMGGLCLPVSLHCNQAFSKSPTAAGSCVPSECIHRETMTCIFADAP